MQMTSYPEVETVNNDDIILVDGEEGGTRSITVENFAEEVEKMAGGSGGIRWDEINEGSAHFMTRIPYGSDYANPAKTLFTTPSNIIYDIVDNISETNPKMALSLRKNIFRGEKLNYVGASGLQEDYKGIFVGDYFEVSINRGPLGSTIVPFEYIPDKIRFRVADIGYYSTLNGTGDVMETVPRHLILVPDTPIGIGQMYTSNATSKGYNSSLIKGYLTSDHTTPDSFYEMIKDALGSINFEMLSHKEYLSSTCSYGRITANTEADVEMILMNEPMVLGHYTYTPDTTTQYYSYRETRSATQLALFRLDNRFIQPYYGGYYVVADSVVTNLNTIHKMNSYWLRDAAGSTDFCCMKCQNPTHEKATVNMGIRPAICVRYRK